MRSISYTLFCLKYVKKIWLHKNIYLKKGIIVQQLYQIYGYASVLDQNLGSGRCLKVDFNMESKNRLL